jgi:hypothetical protein
MQARKNLASASAGQVEKGGVITNGKKEEEGDEESRQEEDVEEKGRKEASPLKKSPSLSARAFVIRLSPALRTRPPAAAARCQ